MRTLRKLILSSAAVALAITALGAPTAAADRTGTLVLVNGRPGPALDICIGDKEYASGVAYGSYFRKNVIATGPKVIRFFLKNDKKTCKGTLVAAHKVIVTPGSDYTIVATRRQPKLVVRFDNHNPLFQGEVPPRGAPYVGDSFIGIYHAADFPANLRWTQYNVLYDFGLPPVSLANLGDPVWTKGQYAVGNPAGTAGWPWRLRVTNPDSDVVLASRGVFTQESRRYQWILVGAGPATARLVLIDMGVSQPTP